MNKTKEVEEIKDGFFQFVDNMKDTLKELTSIDKSARNYDETISHLNENIPEDVEMRIRLEEKKKSKLDRKPELIDKYKLMSGDFEVSNEDKAKKTMKEIQEGTLEGKRTETLQALYIKKMELEQDFKNQEKKSRSKKRELEDLIYEIRDFDYSDKSKSILDLYKQRDELEEEIKNANIELESMSNDIQVCDTIIKDIRDFDIKKELEGCLTKEIKSYINAKKLERKFEEIEEVQPVEVQPENNNENAEQEIKPENDNENAKQQIKQGNDDKKPDFSMIFDAESNKVEFKMISNGKDIASDTRSITEMFSNTRKTNKNVKKQLKENGLKEYSREVNRLFRKLNPVVMKFLAEENCTLLTEYIDAVKNKDIKSMPFKYDIKLENAVGMDDKTYIKLNRQAIRDNKNLGTDFKGTISNLRIKTFLNNFPGFKALKSIDGAIKMLPSGIKEEIANRKGMEHQINRKERMKTAEEKGYNIGAYDETRNDRGGNASPGLRQALEMQDEFVKKLRAHVDEELAKKTAESKKEHQPKEEKDLKEPANND